jgi:two-component system response regulator CpxR
MRCKSQQLSVLMVDDERRFVDNLAKRMSLRGFSPVVAYDGLSALQMLDQQPFSHLILDLRLPDLDGLEVLRRVRESHPDLRVIILSGSGTAEDFRRCRELGAVAFLSKPANLTALTRILSAGEDDVA